MPDTLFVPHPHDATPLHRNATPIDQCKVTPATINGKPCQAVDVPILSCNSVWLRCQREAEAWVAPGGKLIEDPVKRNRRINAAYAQLWLSDHRFQWAGLAAFASKQVGCGLLHAADNIERSQNDIQNAVKTGIDNTDSSAMVAMPASIAAGSAYMYKQLALGNTALFLDIYPLHRFYILRGLAAMRQCLPVRMAIRGKVIWPVDNEMLLFGKDFSEIIPSFELIDQNRIADSVRLLAQHEQVNILQAVIYNDAATRRALDGNQFAWATGFPSGVSENIALTLSSQCRPQQNPFTVWFSRRRTAKLYDADQRMDFVNRAADRFDTLLHGDSAASVKKSLEELAGAEK